MADVKYDPEVEKLARLSLTGPDGEDPNPEMVQELSRRIQETIEDYL